MGLRLELGSGLGLGANSLGLRLELRLGKGFGVPACRKGDMELFYTAATEHRRGGAFTSDVPVSQPRGHKSWRGRAADVSNQPWSDALTDCATDGFTVTCTSVGVPLTEMSVQFQEGIELDGIIALSHNPDVCL